MTDLLSGPLARDAPTSVRRACPLCSENKPDLGPGEVPLVETIEYSEPIPLISRDEFVTRWPAPEATLWGLSCGHTVRASEWCWIVNAEGPREEWSFWWVPRAVYDEVL